MTNSRHRRCPGSWPGLSSEGRCCLEGISGRGVSATVAGGFATLRGSGHPHRMHNGDGAGYCAHPSRVRPWERVRSRTHLVGSRRCEGLATPLIPCPLIPILIAVVPVYAKGVVVRGLRAVGGRVGTSCGVLSPALVASTARLAIRIRVWTWWRSGGRGCAGRWRRVAIVVVLPSGCWHGYGVGRLRGACRVARLGNPQP